MNKVKIQRRVEAVNKISNALNELVPQLQVILKDYAGEKVLKTGGTLMKKVYDKISAPIAECREKYGVRIIPCYSYGYIMLKVDTTYKTGEFSCDYENVTYYLGHIDRNILIDVLPFGKHEMIDLDSLMRDIEHYNKVKGECDEKLAKLKSKVHPTFFDELKKW